MTDQELTCSENWHIFDPAKMFEPGAICKCGKKRNTSELGTLEDV